MNFKEELKLLQNWKTKHQKFQKEMNKLSGVFGDGLTEMPLFEQMYSILDDYIDALSILVGDNSEWLSYFAWDCEFGKKPMKVKIGAVEKEIKSFRDLLEIIYETRGEG